MKIGFFTDTYFPQLSGVSTSIQVLAEELRSQGHEVIIFTTTDPHAEAEADIVRISSIPFISFSDRRIAYRGFDRCLKIARMMDLDIIHTHTEFSMGLLGKYVASRLKIPTIHTYHTMYENYTHYIMDGLLVQARHVRKISRYYCNSSTAIIAPSALTKATLESYGVTTPIQIIPTGVKINKKQVNQINKLRQSLGLKPDERVLLSLSRLSKEKNLTAVLEMYQKVKGIFSTVKLVIVGDGPERSAMEEFNRIHKLGILFVGSIPHEQVSIYYQMADLYINASQSESQGLTYLEAVTNGCPLIAHRSRYLESIIKKPAWGTLYDEDLSFDQAVIDFLSNQKVGQTVEVDNTSLCELSSEHFASQVLNYYQDILNTYDSEDSKLFDGLYAKTKDIVREIMIGGKV